MSGLHKSYYRYTAFLKGPMDITFIPPDELLQAWQRDGIFLRAFLLRQRRVQMVCETTATITPVQIAQRLKGRLNHYLRQHSPAYTGFDRDFFLGTLGQNDRGIVAAYVRDQVDRSDLVDSLYRERLKALRFHDDPGQPPRGKHKGIHDHVLHIVLVTQGRYRMFSSEAKKVSDSLIEGGKSVGMDIMEFSIMPDHAHIMLRPDHHRNSQQSLDDLKSASARLLRQSRFWQKGGYTGTVGPYKMNIALRNTRQQKGWIAPKAVDGLSQQRQTSNLAHAPKRSFPAKTSSLAHAPKRSSGLPGEQGRLKKPGGPPWGLCLTRLSHALPSTPAPLSLSRFPPAREN